MPATNNRYSTVSIALHWIVGIGIIVIAAAEMLRGELPKGHAVREGLKFLHNPAGTVIFALVLVRIVWRLLSTAPGMPADMRPWEKFAANLTHLALYAVMIAIPLLGIVFTLARGRPIDFGVFQIAYPLTHIIDATTMKGMKSAHEWLGQAVLGLAFIHAAAALWHHYVRRDDVLTRMLPKRGSPAKPSSTAGESHSAVSPRA